MVVLRHAVVLGRELGPHFPAVPVLPVGGAEHLEEADDARPEVDGDRDLDERDEEEEDGEHLDADQPQGHAHPDEVGQEEGEGHHDPGQHQPPLALGRAPDQEGAADGVDHEQDQTRDEEDEHGLKKRETRVKSVFDVR